MVGLVGAMLGLAVLLKGAPWWAILGVSWTVGAILNHGLWVLIHECTHNLVFRSPRRNALLQLFANLPILFPAAISFRKYHLLHHRFQGDPEFDADLASPLEARLVGNSTLGKAFWMLFFWAFQASRVGRLKRVPFFDRWYVANLVVQAAFITGVVMWLGWGALAFLLLSSIFSIGLHPVGARWIQEHYVVVPNQETYSYYGPFNRVAFNVGFHNEHHDVMRVPWSRLPRVRAIAPEFYDSLHSHTSWTKLWLRFLFDPKLSLFSRVVRPGGVAPGSAPSRGAPRRAGRRPRCGARSPLARPSPRAHPSGVARADHPRSSMKTRRRGVMRALGRTVLATAGVSSAFAPGSAIGEEERALPRPLLDGRVSLEEALRERRSVREFRAQPLPIESVGQLLWAAQGVTREAGGRTAPSAGALYPLEVYAASESETLHYLPAHHRAERWANGDLRPALARAAHGQEPVAQAPLSDRHHRCRGPHPREVRRAGASLRRARGGPRRAERAARGHRPRPGRGADRRVRRRRGGGGTAPASR